MCPARGSLKGVAHRERRFFTIFNVFFDGSVYILRAGALQEELFSLQEHPPPQFVADKSLIGLPPKFHLHCYPMQGGLGDLHKKMKKKTEIFYLHIDREYTIILTAL